MNPPCNRNIRSLLPALKIIKDEAKSLRGEGARRADEGKLRARKLRKNQTDAEQRMWYFLRDRRLGHYKFLRQNKIGPFYVDFICRHKKLIIEIDGGQHLESQYDDRRTQFLINSGFKVVRFWNNEIFTHIDNVLAHILDVLES